VALPLQPLGDICHVPGGGCHTQTEYKWHIFCEDVSCEDGAHGVLTVAHQCSRDCLHGDDNPVTFKGHNPLCIPMEFGWTRYELG